MSRRGDKFQGTPIKCSKCELEAVGVPGRKHRRCSGQSDQPRREKRAERLPKEQRGTWM